MQLKHRKKRQYHQTQKLSKLLFFLHCLQMDRGIPINQIYEEDNFQSLPTHRFHQIVRTFETSFKPCDSESDNEFSFYSEDSYEYIGRRCGHESSIDRKRLIRKLVPMLDLSQLPAYESSDEEGGDDPALAQPEKQDVGKHLPRSQGEDSRDYDLREQSQLDIQMRQRNHLDESVNQSIVMEGGDPREQSFDQMSSRRMQPLKQQILD